MRLLKTAEVRDILDKWDENEISFSKMVELLNEKALKNLESQKPKQCSCSFEIVKSNTTTSGYKAVNFTKILEEEIEQAQKITQDKIKRELNFNKMLYGTK